MELAVFDVNLNYNLAMSIAAGGMLGELAIAAAVKQKARELGFDLVGIASAEPSAYREYFRGWLESGQAGEMGYLAKRFEERTDPRVYLPGAASVICVGINYFVPLEKAEPNRGRIARYALGQDYHELIAGRLHALADWLREIEPKGQTRCSVDTAPVMEKELAARAGIGWLGKNTCIINERIGSWIFLGEVLTTLALPADEAAMDRCGSCRRCIDACPTQAITEPYHLDARKCISYLTIEHRADVEPELAAKMGQWMYGCDVCQEVCPWNRDPPAAIDPALAPRWPSGTLDPAAIAEWTDADYQRELRGSAMKRVKLPMLKRNAGMGHLSLVTGHLPRTKDK
jgi:epoxyqueuosine reductase